MVLNEKWKAEVDIENIRIAALAAYSMHSDLRHIIENYGMPIGDYLLWGITDLWFVSRHGERPPVYQDKSYEDCISWVLKEVQQNGSC